MGWGHFSTVWLSWDSQREQFVALKIVKSAEHYTEAAEDEILLLEKVNESYSLLKLSSESESVVRLLDHFRHRGPHGLHICMVFEVLGENLLKIIRRFEHRGLPIVAVKGIARQIMAGLDLLHRQCGIIHTDLKPENVLICLEQEEIRRMAISALEKALREAEMPPPEEIPRGSFYEHLKKVASNSQGDPNQSKERLHHLYRLAYAQGHASKATTVDITDGMSGFNITNGSQLASMRPQSPMIVTAPSGLFLANETMSRSASRNLDTGRPRSSTPSLDNLRMSMSPSPVKRKDEKSRSQSRLRLTPLEGVRVKIADLGNACWTDKHFTNDIQTRQYRAPEVILGMRYDTSCDIWSAACMIFELLTGDFLFAPHSGKRYNKNEDHVAQMIELLGRIPRSFALGGKYSFEIFNRRGELRHIRDLEFWKLENVLVEKYAMSVTDAAEISSFLLPMLEYEPTKRATAQECLKHPWLAK